MSSSYTYVKELELLILDKLLPVYEKHQKSQGVLNPLSGINQDLLSQIKAKKKLPALLRAKEKHT
jgi:hypothetical protein